MQKCAIKQYVFGSTRKTSTQLVKGRIVHHSNFQHKACCLDTWYFFRLNSFSFIALLMLYCYFAVSLLLLVQLRYCFPRCSLVAASMLLQCWLLVWQVLTCRGRACECVQELMFVQCGGGIGWWACLSVSWIVAIDDTWVQLDVYSIRLMFVRGEGCAQARHLVRCA